MEENTSEDFDVTANLLNILGVEGVNSDNYEIEADDEETKQAMRIYNKISDIFIEEKVSLWTSLKIVSAMGDALSAFIATIPLRDED